MIKQLEELADKYLQPLLSCMDFERTTAVYGK